MNFLYPISLLFQSPEQLQKALHPHSIEELEQRLCFSQVPLTFQYNPNLSPIAPAFKRNSVEYNLLENPVLETDLLTVYYPQTPRVPNHLVIAFNQLHPQGICSITKEEHRALFTTICKIAEIYQTIPIQGFVIAQYDQPQPGHLNRYVVEILPHLPGFHKVKNIVDKVDCNRYVLFRHENLSPVLYQLTPEEIQKQTLFWKQALQQETNPLQALSASFPATLQDSHHEEAQQILQQHLAEILQNRGGFLPQSPFPISLSMPTKLLEACKVTEIPHCHFCNPTSFQKQVIWENPHAQIIYNHRKMASGCCFVIIPKRHTPKIYGLSSEEMQNLSIIRQSLTAALKECYPENTVIVYSQDDPVVGQSILHSHEHVVSVNPDTIALSWTLMSLCPYLLVTEEEKTAVIQKLRPIIQKQTELFFN